MPRIVIWAALAALALLAWFWVSGGFDSLAIQAALEQRDYQNRMARALRALRGGEAGALAVLLTVCFAYGFFHSVGPGHGKVLLGGYGFASKVPVARIVGIGLAASLGQSVTAIVLVYAGATGASGWWLWAALGLLAIETAVFFGFGMKCPLTGMAVRYGAEKGWAFDTFLPERATRYTFRFFGTVMGVGVLLLVLRWTGVLG